MKNRSFDPLRVFSVLPSHIHDQTACMNSRFLYLFEGGNEMCVNVRQKNEKLQMRDGDCRKERMK